jgi:hypothetical protein
LAYPESSVAHSLQLRLLQRWAQMQLGAIREGRRVAGAVSADPRPDIIFEPSGPNLHIRSDLEGSPCASTKMRERLSTEAAALVVNTLDRPGSGAVLVDQLIETGHLVLQCASAIRFGARLCPGWGCCAVNLRVFRLYNEGSTEPRARTLSRARSRPCRNGRGPRNGGRRPLPWRTGKYNRPPGASDAARGPDSSPRNRRDCQR